MGKISAIYEAYIRIFFKKHWLVAFSIVFPISFFLFFSMIFTNYDDVNRIPVGLINEDQTLLSEKVIQNLKDNPALRVATTDYDQAMKLLKSNRIEAIFIFKTGFETSIQTSQFENAIELIYLDKSTIGPTLGDIIASEVMTDLAIYKSANTALKYETRYGYENLFDKITLNGQQFVEDNHFEMTIDSRVRTPQKLLDEEIDIQSILKLNITFGFTLVVFSFVILFSNSHLIDTKQTLIKRMITTGIQPFELIIGEYLAILTSAFVIIIVQVILVIFGLQYNSLSDILILTSTLLLHVGFLANIIVILTLVVKNKTKYQSILAPLVFFFGLIGGAFWSTEFLSDNLMWLSYLSPFHWSLKILNSIVLSGNIDYLSVFAIYWAFNILGSILAFVLYRHHYHKIHTSR